jgi:hypothetical protein
MAAATPDPWSRRRWFVMGADVENSLTVCIFVIEYGGEYLPPRQAATKTRSRRAADPITVLTR